MTTALASSRLQEYMEDFDLLIQDIDILGEDDLRVLDLELELKRAGISAQLTEFDPEDFDNYESWRGRAVAAKISAQKARKFIRGRLKERDIGIELQKLQRKLEVRNKEWISRNDQDDLLKLAATDTGGYYQIPADVFEKWKASL